MGKTILIAAVHALIMIGIGVFWMFMWLLGANGYSEKKGTMILGGNLVLVILSVILSSLASGFFSKILQTKTGWSIWLIAPVTIVAVTIIAVVLMFIASLVIVSLVGSTR